MDIEECLVGRLAETQCASHPFYKDKIDVKDLTQDELKILKYRVPNFPQNPIGKICPGHYSSSLVNYSSHQKKCSDPYKKHRIVVKSSLRDISLETCEQFLEASGVLIPPGNKVCTNCLKLIMDKIATGKTDLSKSIPKQDTVPSTKSDSQASNISTNSLSESQTTSCSVEPYTSDDGSQFLPESQEQKIKEEKFKRLLDVVDLPMPKRQKLGTDRLEKWSTNLANSICGRVVDQVNDTFQTNVNVDIQKLKRDSKSLDSIIVNIKNAYERETKHSAKIKILTLFPSDWTYSDIVQHVECSSYMVRKANQVREKIGVLADSERKKFLFFSEQYIDLIEDFYRNNSRMCSGAKESVVVLNKKTNKKEKLQKKLILCSIKELYHKFIQENMETLERIPGFSFFASLRPKDCKLAGDPGTHTVCVCSEHQNVKLRCRSLSQTLDYRVLLDLGVCSVENENCMLQDCPNCPGTEAIRDYLKSQKLLKTSGTITFFNWTSIDIATKSSDGTQNNSRVTLREITVDVKVFNEQFVKDIYDLRKHHYISESQKNYCEYAKNSLEYDTGILMMDFAENYTFIAQDSTQAFYYNNTQATLHPFVLYYRDSSDKLKHTSFCIISDYLKHNAYVVNIFQENVMKSIKERFPHIKKLIYFSDGAPTQYKNKNNFANLCAHEKDFGIKIESYNFFATSHGKGPCDGIGAVAKRTVREASLVLTPEKQILTPLSMYEYLSTNMVSTTFLWVSSQECEQRQRKLQKRFDMAQTVEGTRGYHYMRPIDEKPAEFKCISLSRKSKIESIMK